MHIRVSKMAQYIKALAAKTTNQSSTQDPYGGRREANPTRYPLTATHTLCHACVVSTNK